MDFSAYIQHEWSWVILFIAAQKAIGFLLTYSYLFDFVAKEGCISTIKIK